MPEDIIRKWKKDGKKKTEQEYLRKLPGKTCCHSKTCQEKAQIRARRQPPHCQVRPKWSSTARLKFSGDGLIQLGAVSDTPKEDPKALEKQD